MFVNQKELASVIGITPRRVRDLRSEGFFQFQNESGKYLLEPCVQEYIEYKVKSETKRSTTYDKEKEQAEHENLKKKITQLKLRKMKRELHETEDVEQFLTDMLYSFKSKLLSLPNKIAILIVGESDVNKIISVLQAEIINALDELAQHDLEELYQEDEFMEDEEEESE